MQTSCVGRGGGGGGVFGSVLILHLCRNTGRLKVVVYPSYNDFS